MVNKLKHVVIYTDGSCSGNPGAGGWAAILRYNNIEKEIFGASSQTTNNQMELTAALKALNELKIRCKVDLYTDSAYLCNGITKWLPKWKLNNWRTSDKKPVKNIDIWQDLDKAVEKHNITWHLVKGHSGDIINDRVDALAKQAVKK